MKNNKHLFYKRIILNDFDNLARTSKKTEVQLSKEYKTQTIRLYGYYCYNLS